MKKSVVWILTNNQKEVLLQKRTADYKRFPKMWTLFGGGTNSNEKPEKAVKKELKEELGIELNLKFCGEFFYTQLKGKKQYIYLFKGKLNNLKKTSLKEGNGVAFFSKEELKDLNCPDIELIKKWI